MGLTMFESLGLFLGWIACTYVVVQITFGIQDALRDVNEELADKFNKKLSDIIHRVRVEKRDGVYYWYDTDDSEFLAQGTTDQEIINILKSRFPDHIFYLPTNHFISAKHDWAPTLAPGNLPSKIDSISQQ
jgi:hypothetical protein